jgi:hypothetical protein
VSFAACSSSLPRTPIVEVPVGDGPVALAAGDVDRDGAVDLVTANTSSTLSVRFQRGTAWHAMAEQALPAPLHLIELVDLDRDGDLDVVGTSHDSGLVWVLAGDGTGTFAASTSVTAVTANRPHNHGLAVGDLDGDGDSDVVVVDQEAKLAVALHNDGGALSVASTVALGAQAYPPALGDLNRDGRLDLVVPLVGGQAVGVWLGDGTAFTPAPGSPHRTREPRPYSIGLADLDRDGNLDVIAPHDDTDRVSVLLGDGIGQLRAAASSPVAFGKRVARIATPDLDGDGAIDVVGVGEGALIVARGDGRGGLEPSAKWGVGWTVIALDLDRDGAPDLVVPDLERDRVCIWPGSR